MVNQRSRAVKERVAKLGRSVYAKRIRRKVTREKKGRVVALDVFTGEYEVADDALAAVDRLLTRLPDAEIWLERVGFPAFVMMRGRQ